MHPVPRLLVATLLLAAALARAQSGAPPDAAVAASSHASSPAAPVVDPGAFAGLERTIADTTPDVRSVVVLQNGRLAFEYDRAGSTRDDLRDVQSVTKSVLSLLVGIALAQGRIASLDQAVVALLPELAEVNSDPRAANVTVRHLLTMTAGFDVEARVRADRPGLARQAIARPLKAAPGERFAYDNLAADLLAAVLERAVGQTVPAFAAQQLFEPLGIMPPRWQTDAEGHALGSRGLQLRTRDMAALGQLVLQQGTWGGRQIVPKDFVAAAGQRHNAGGPPVGLAYGYLWWVVPSDAVRQTILASGFGGQFIWVYPPLALVVAITSEVSPASNARGQAMQLIRGPIYGAALKSEPAR